MPVNSHQSSVISKKERRAESGECPSVPSLRTASACLSVIRNPMTYVLLVFLVSSCSLFKKSPKTPVNNGKTKDTTIILTDTGRIKGYAIKDSGRISQNIDTSTAIIDSIFDDRELAERIPGRDVDSLRAKVDTIIHHDYQVRKPRSPLSAPRTLIKGSQKGVNYDVTQKGDKEYINITRPDSQLHNTLTTTVPLTQITNHESLWVWFSTSCGYQWGRCTTAWHKLPLLTKIVIWIIGILLFISIIEEWIRNLWKKL